MIVFEGKTIDIKLIRRKLGMSQERFSVAYRIPLPTLKNWEQGRRMPEAPSIAYLYIISRIPDVIYKALNEYYSSIGKNF
jgi:putative transcriptional regulator